MAGNTSTPRPAHAKRKYYKRKTEKNDGGEEEEDANDSPKTRNSIQIKLDPPSSQQPVVRLGPVSDATAGLAPQGEYFSV